jgi:hypothetical protein
MPMPVSTTSMRRPAAVVGRGEAHRDAAFQRELQGVGDQVAQDLAQAVGVAAPQAQGLGRDEDLEGQALGARLGGVGLADRQGQAGQVEVALGDLQAAGLDLREVQHVVEHASSTAPDSRITDSRSCWVAAQLAHGHDLGHGQHAVQRGADLVAHIGQEVRLQDVGGVGVVARLDQFGHGAAQVVVVDLQPRDQVVEAVGQALEDVVVGGLLHGLKRPSAAVSRMALDRRSIGLVMRRARPLASRIARPAEPKNRVPVKARSRAMMSVRLGWRADSDQRTRPAGGQLDRADQGVDLGVVGRADLGDDAGPGVGQRTPATLGALATASRAR